MYQIDKIQYLQIGVQGENAAQTIEIDMSTWAEEFHDATFHVLFKPYNAIAPSPMLTTYVEPVLSWTVTLGATAVAGVGYTEVRAIDSGTGMVKKSRIIPTAVDNSVSGLETDDPPEPFEDWVNSVLAAKDTAVEAKDDAEAAQEAAEEARDAAQAAAGDFQGLSVTATGLDEGESPTVIVTHSSGGFYNISFGIPKGEKGDPAPEEQVVPAVDAYLSNVITNPDSPPLDRTLSSNEAATPADMTGILKSAFEYENAELIQFTPNKYIITNKSVIDPVSDMRDSGTGQSCAVVDCNSFDGFIINGHGASVGRLWAFIDGSGNKVGNDSGNGATGNNLLLFAPQGAKKLIINTDQNKLCFKGLILSKAIRDNTSISALGLYTMRRYLERPYIINSSLKWGGFETYKHICYPVAPYTPMSVKANKDYDAVVSFLTSEAYEAGTDPLWCHETDEDGNVITLSRRYLIKKGKRMDISAPEDAAYLYISSIVDSGNDNLPLEILINGTDIIKNPLNVNNAENDEQSSVVFFADFNDASDLSKFRYINNSGITGYTGLGSYDSIFLTGSDNVYVDSGMLVLRCYKPDEPVPDPGNQSRTFRYKAPYISTAESFAIRKGKISARISGTATPRDGFLFTFFTFGQNELWPKAPEFDICESYANVTRDTTTGAFIDGTYLSKFGCFTHYKANNDSEATYSQSYYADIITVENGEITAWNKKWSRGDVSLDEWFKNWHIYSVQWDEELVNYYIDDELVRSIDVSELTNTIWNSPQDIRINFKARQWATSDSEALLVDWIKCESFDYADSVQKITHSDITLSPNEYAYVSPTFAPSGACNVAYSLSSSNESVVECLPLSKNYERAENKIHAKANAVSGQSAVITMTSSGGAIVGKFTVAIT